VVGGAEDAVVVAVEIVVVVRRVVPLGRGAAVDDTVIDASVSSTN
jgi:hypothetical protein